jgi:hypothetical protein
MWRTLLGAAHRVDVGLGHSVAVWLRTLSKASWSEAPLGRITFVAGIQSNWGLVTVACHATHSFGV